MPFQITDIETTPNPNANKFNVAGQIASSTESFLNAGDADAANDELAQSLFAVKGVVGVMFCQSFVTINKSTSASWARIRPKIEIILQSTNRNPL